MTVFADTGFYVALLSQRDGLHHAAVEASRAHQGVVVTTEFVLMELANFLGGFARFSFVRFYDGLARAPDITIVPASTELFADALRLYREREDKRWSLTDCSSFAVMRAHGIQMAFTFDHHFEQAGFRVLPQAE